eukprot:4989702-Pyramimonas_sp.AAC.1
MQRHFANLIGAVHMARKQKLISNTMVKKLLNFNVADSVLKHLAPCAGKELLEGLADELPDGRPRDEKELPRCLELAELIPEPA